MVWAPADSRRSLPDSGTSQALSVIVALTARAAPTSAGLITALQFRVAEALKRLPRISLDLVLPRLPELGARLQAGARVLDIRCGGGWATVQIAERFP